MDRSILAVALCLIAGLSAAVYPPLPNPALTPGATNPAVTQATIATTVCISGYTAKIRSVSEATKKAVLEEYGKTDPKCCEVDHLISLEIGGSNDIKNLWAEPYLPLPGARQKDVLETHLKRLVCSGEITLDEAQKEIRSDWYAAYLKYGLGK